MYVASAGNSAIHEFDRGGDGALALKPGSPCVATPGRSASGAVHRRAGDGVAAGPRDRGRLAVRRVVRHTGRRDRVRRSVPDGALGQANSGAECVQQSNRTHCAVGRGLPGANSIAVRGATDLRRHRRGRLVTVNRDPGSGLMQGAARRRRASAAQRSAGCTTGRRARRGRRRHRGRRRRPGLRRGAQATTAEGVVTQSGRVAHVRPPGEGPRAPRRRRGLRQQRRGANCTTGRGLATSGNSRI